MFVALVAIGFVLAVEAGLYLSLPEVFDCSSDYMSDGAVDR